MLTKVVEFAMGARPVEHRLGKKIAPGVWRVIHPLNCECQMIHTVRHARWINYNQLEGIIRCDHCSREESLPCPAVRDRILSRRVWMDAKAIARDLWNFQIKHENCPVPPEESPDPNDPSLKGQCSHLIRKPDGEPLVST